ncbi:MAG TPA: hypothetical protein VIE64_09885 [Solirubrobacterales bacterium]|jgi:hypothetical protein
MNHPLDRVHRDFRDLRRLAIRLWAANMTATIALLVAVIVTNA